MAVPVLKPPIPTPPHPSVLRYHVGNGANGLQPPQHHPQTLPAMTSLSPVSWSHALQYQSGPDGLASFTPWLSQYNSLSGCSVGTLGHEPLQWESLQTLGMPTPHTTYRYGDSSPYVDGLPLSSAHMMTSSQHHVPQPTVDPRHAHALPSQQPFTPFQHLQSPSLSHLSGLHSPFIDTNALYQFPIMAMHHAQYNTYTPPPSVITPVVPSQCCHPSALSLLTPHSTSTLSDTTTSHLFSNAPMLKLPQDMLTVLAVTHEHDVSVALSVGTSLYHPKRPDETVELIVYGPSQPSSSTTSSSLGNTNGHKQQQPHTRKHAHTVESGDGDGDDDDVINDHDPSNNATAKRQKLKSYRCRLCNRVKRGHICKVKMKMIEEQLQQEGVAATATL